jgi:hypothetical protein
METPAKYKVDMPICPPSVQRAKIIHSAYFQAISNTVNSLLLGYESFSSDEEVIERAIAITDLMIRKVKTSGME